MTRRTSKIINRSRTKVRKHVSWPKIVKIQILVKDEIVYIAVKDESYNDNEEDDEMALISHVSKNDTWIIGSGCSHHMTGEKTQFENFEDYDGGSVTFCNNEPCCIK